MVGEIGRSYDAKRVAATLIPAWWAGARMERTIVAETSLPPGNGNDSVASCVT